jgi:isoquinoline 1-oxidoreductase beta subunit
MTTTADNSAASSSNPLSAKLERRSFLGFVVGGATLAAAADMSLASPASAFEIPSAPQVATLFDLNDLLTLAALPTSQLIKIVVNTDGTASFELPRSENGQGITTSTAMIIAEELEMPVENVKVTLADARPELLFNQLTAGSNTTISTYTPIRVAAAIAKGELLKAAATLLNDNVGNLVAKGGIIQSRSGGKSVGYGELAALAASSTTVPVKINESDLKAQSGYRVVGVAQNRLDAREAVTGKKTYTTDLQVPDALPTMLCRAPKLNGRPKEIKNLAQVKAMPGVTDVVMIDTGIAVRAATFGQCIDAVRVVVADWYAGTVEGLSDKDIEAQMRLLTVPFIPIPALGAPSAGGVSLGGILGGLTSGLGGVVAPLPGGLAQQVTGAIGGALGKVGDVITQAAAKSELLTSVETDAIFYFRSNSAMDTNAAVADVRNGSAEVWAALKSPIAAQGKIAEAIGMTVPQVKVHVMQGGGSFGRRLFFDAAVEAAKVSKAIGKPVKLMWHRADDARVGRTHPMAISRIQAVVNKDTKTVAAFVQIHSSVETDYRQGLGDSITAAASSLPSGLGNTVGFSQTVFQTTQELPYDFGVTTQQLLEPGDGSIPLGPNPRFNTSSMRNIYSPDVRTAAELTVDKIAALFDEDPLAFRLARINEPRVAAVLEKVAAEGGWGKAMPDGTAQGIAIHKEYKGATAALVEIDCRPQTTGRTVDGSPEYVTGPRVTKVTFAIDAGLVINPRGLEAQMQGGINDGIAQALTSSLHLVDGHFLEGSWDNYFYTRQWNVAPDVKVFVMPSEEKQPGGAGEAGVAASMAAVACAYARATKTVPAYFPVNHRDPLHFTPKSFVPPLPASPTDGLSKTY